MNQDQQRDAFEAWVLNRWGQLPAKWETRYIEGSTQFAWEAWKAAIQWRTENDQEEARRT